MMNEQTLNLKDIHLPAAVSWWPVAPGWWLLLTVLILLTVIIFISRKIYLSKQLKRDITTELENIKQQYQQTGDSYQLATALSILLRRAAISFSSTEHVAGLTGEQWLDWLQQTNSNKTNSATTGTSDNKNFNSELGKILITVPYLDKNHELNYDAQALITLCESWLLSSHGKTHTAADSFQNKSNPGKAS